MRRRIPTVHAHPARAPLAVRASLVLVAATLSMLALTAPAAVAQDTTQAGVRIGLTYQMGVKPGVFVLPVAGAGGDSLRAIVQRDLDYGDRVTIIGPEPDSPLADLPRAAGGRFNYELYGRLGAAALVELTRTASGVRAAVHDVGAKRVAQTRDVTLPANAASHAWRWGVHGLADEIERWITGVQGIAKSRVLFVRDGDIFVIDSDGAGETRVAGGSQTLLSPAWAPQGDRIAYSQMTPSGTRIVVRDLRTKRERPLVATPGGLNITPTFAPGGEVIVYAHGEEAGTDLVAASTRSDAPGRRITVGRGTDNVSPTFSPDGRRIAFTSGRSGHPEVYIMDADGTNAELLTPFSFGDQYYRSNPDWSPDGRSIAFQSQIAGQFQIMTISLRDRSIKQHTSEGRNEDPSWAPDGRHVVFTSNRTGTRQLFVLDVESGRVRQLTRGGGARLAAWSPHGVGDAAGP
jgi:TolB protein